ncbi:PREDICTED: uncharacterized protein LOC109233802 [Nicotiana attenuata]|uniref:U1-type domain-containing protein n=1 Tax=Nicotiana attenuata TaxID=49451 RepID=A0A1J6ICN9_NICAT|nr:PREDICTED: uncharacterized protein LOC109233802 [Nicotiana attenuata]OIS98271.1 hypothetical protein A4A49_20436 [Nicotiana attenuata]
MVLKEYTSPESDQPPSTSRSITQNQISGLIPSTEQQTIPFPVGYMAPHIGPPSSFNHFQDSTSNAHEAMLREEIEKERIRKEIIVEEVARRRVLELEVRRELTSLPPQDRVGYMAPHIGQSSSFNHFQDSTCNAREAILRKEMEERIREEIIAEEVARRRVLELEVRRELMMEAMLRGDSFTSFSSFSPNLPFLKQQAEEKLGMSVSESEPGARHQDMEQISDVVPFKHRAVEPSISTLKLVPVPKNQSAKGEISQLQPSLEPELSKDMAKPDTISSGAKRKAITPTTEVANEPSSISAVKKNVKEWTCALCQVSSTSEAGLNMHFEGKKHKSKEAASRGENSNVSLLTKKPKSMQLVESCIDMRQGQKSKESSSGSSDNVANADDLKKHANNTIDEKQNNKEHQKREYKFWCETCKVGTFSEKVMEDHRIGKKHARHLQQLISKNKQCS